MVNKVIFRPTTGQGEYYNRHFKGDIDKCGHFHANNYGGTV